MNAAQRLSDLLRRRLHERPLHTRPIIAGGGTLGLGSVLAVLAAQLRGPIVDRGIHDRPLVESLEDEGLDAASGSMWLALINTLTFRPDQALGGRDEVVAHHLLEGGAGLRDGALLSEAKRRSASLSSTTTVPGRS